MDVSAGGGSTHPLLPLRGKLRAVTLAVLLSLSLFLLFFHLYSRWLLLRRARRREPPFLPSSCALDPGVLRAIPVVVRGDPDASAADCAVCLSELEPGEKLRVLPGCQHEFHIDCIDVWFSSHSTCPLCRAVVEVAAPAREAPSRPPTPSATSFVAPTGGCMALLKWALVRGQGGQRGRGLVEELDLERGEWADRVRPSLPQPPPWQFPGDRRPVRGEAMVGRIG